MTRDQFISWLKGFTAAVEETPTKGQWETIVSELNKIQECIDWGSPIGEGGWGVPNTNPFPKINPKPHPFTPYKPTPNPYTGGKEGKVRYGDICGCNPENGGSGICGCIMANELVDPTLHGKTTITTTTDTINVSSTPYGFWPTTSTGKMPDNVTLNYTIKDDSKNS